MRNENGVVSAIVFTNSQVPTHVTTKRVTVEMLDRTLNLMNSQSP